MGILGVTLALCVAGAVVQPASAGPVFDDGLNGEGGGTPTTQTTPSGGGRPSEPATSSTNNGDNTGCGGSILGFRPWYDGLCANGEIKEIPKDGTGAALTTFIWTIVLNVIFDISLAVGYIAVAMVIYGGYLYIMSQGNPVSMTKAKKTLTAAVIGVVIAMGATVIVNTLKLILGIANDGWNQGTVTQERVEGVFGWAYGIAGLVAVVFIIKSGVDYMISTGDPSKTKKALHGLIAAVVGLIIVILASVITGFITSSIGGAM